MDDFTARLRRRASDGVDFDVMCVCGHDRGKHMSGAPDLIDIPCWYSRLHDSSCFCEKFTPQLSIEEAIAGLIWIAEDLS